MHPDTAVYPATYGTSAKPQRFHPLSEVVLMADRYLRRCPDCQEEHRQALAELARVQKRQARSR
jgi:hypothetical protein